MPARERDIPTIIEPGSPKRVERSFLEEVNLLEDLSFGELYDDMLYSVRFSHYSHNR